MIIECINCSKNFNVNSDLIPAEGRLIKCGSCNHIWHFKREKFSKIQKPNNVQDNHKDLSLSKNDIEENKSSTMLEAKDLYQNTSENLDPVNKKNNKKMNNLFSYLLVIIISFVVFIILVDTLKSPLINLFPELEIFLFNLFETIQDIKLFIIDLT